MDIRKNPNKHENELMLDLMIVRSSLAEHAPAVRERMRCFPYAWRDLCLVQRLVDKLQRQLLATMPPQRYSYYNAVARNAEFIINMGGPVRQDRYIRISEEKLGRLTACAIEGACGLCFRDGREVARCGLRDALLEVAPPPEIEDNPDWSRCEYRQIAGKLAADGRPSL